ncbi:MAG: HAMP domain-containing histidine kinase [Chitinophagaceae bacterium]|nr:HAMP domain-containing histidine kinase [Chitinophagaceae bacterium]
MKKTFITSLGLMIAAILLITAFQVYWLSMKVEEERRTLRFRTNALFRESVFELQSSKLKIDSSAKWMVGYPPGVARFADVVRRRISDSLMPALPENKNSIITLERPPGTPPSPDSSSRIPYRAGDRYFEVLMGIDSLQDSLHITDIKTVFAKNLNREQINVPFFIIKTDGDGFKRDEPGRREWNKVVIGLSHPITYALQLGNDINYIFLKLLPQLLFSVFLLALTISAFIFLYRSLKAQHRLTDIKNDFISNITHELKTPIATVSVAVEAIKNFDVLKQPEKTKEYLGIAGNELNRLSLLVDKVLKLSMFEKQQVNLQFEQFDIKQLVQEVLTSMSLQFEKAQATVNFNYSGDHFIISADHLHLTSVIYNLLDNALKYSNKKPVIDVTIQSNGKECTLRVKDNGVGVPVEYKDKIFEKFFRVPAGNKHNVKGYGLGLSYVAHIVQQHKGTIHVQSQPNKGSEFIVTIPVANV